jgi:stage V sporulation protein B
MKFTNVANLFPNQVRFALLPTMYRILEEQKTQKSGSDKRIFKIILKYITIFAIPFAVSMFLFSAPIIHLIFGQKYVLSIPFVKLFSLFICFRFIQTPFNLFYVAMHKHKELVYCQAFASFLNLILNLLLIPQYTAYGAGIATVISECILLLVIITLGTKYSVWNLRDVFLLIFSPVVAGAVSLFLTYSFLFGKVNLFLQIFILLISYLLLLVVFKVFSKDDKDLFSKVFQKKNIVRE